jgi:hypothetical protein
MRSEAGSPRPVFACTDSALGYAKNPSNSARAPTMIDRDVKELFIGFAAIVILAVAIVYLRQ